MTSIPYEDRNLACERGAKRAGPTNLRFLTYAQKTQRSTIFQKIKYYVIFMMTVIFLSQSNGANRRLSAARAAYRGPSAMPSILKLALDFRFPETLQISAHGIETGPVDPVDAPGTVRMVRDQACLLQDFEMLGYRRTADGQAPG